MAVLKPLILRITEVADATSKINHDEQTGTEVKDTPLTITEYATKSITTYVVLIIEDVFMLHRQLAFKLCQTKNVKISIVL